MDVSLKLVEDARRGSLEAFSELVRLHQAPVRAFFSQYIAHWDRVDDLAQETFLGAYQSLKSFAGEVPFGTWLFGIARNKLLMHLRQVQQQHLRRDECWSASVAEWWAERIQADSGTRSLESLDREIEALKTCIKSLPPASAAMIEDHYFKGRRIVDMARLQGKGERAVGMTLLRIRQALQRCVRSKFAEAGVTP